jgi:hypothetical protein
MTAPEKKLSDRAQAGPAADDPVVNALRQADERYREMFMALQAQTDEAGRELASLRTTNEDLTHDLATTRRELDAARVQRQRHDATAEALATVVKNMHRSVFSGNIYELILKACLTLTGATRGLFVSVGPQRQLRVRAAVGIDGYMSSRPPSAFLAALCAAALDSERVLSCDDVASMAETPPDGESFDTCIAAPVAIRGQVSGVVIVADKPGGAFDDEDTELLLSVGNHAALALENERLQREIEEAYLSIVTVLAETMAARHEYDSRFKDSGCRLARAVAERLGASQYEQSVAYYAALLHDVGNVAVSDGVLNKPGPLLDAERALVRAHAQIGHDLLSQIPLLDAVARVVRHHHERYDGTGYPDGLKHDQIPLAARIVAVVDAFGSMVAPRSYRPALSQAEACEELRRCAGTQFDPRVVDAFLAGLDAEGQSSLRRIDDTDAPAPELNLLRGVA